MSVDKNKRKDLTKAPRKHFYSINTLSINERKFLKMNGE